MSASGQVTGATETVWSKPTFVTSSLGAGTALVGVRAGATVWNRGGARVEASNSSDDYFRRNLVAIRAERRLGLACYRSQAFVECRFES